MAAHLSIATFISVNTPPLAQCDHHPLLQSASIWLKGLLAWLNEANLFKFGYIINQSGNPAIRKVTTVGKVFILIKNKVF